MYLMLKQSVVGNKRSTNYSITGSHLNETQLRSRNFQWVVFISEKSVCLNSVLYEILFAFSVYILY